MNDDKTKYPGRPPRLGRVFAQSPLYFVTFNTWQRKPVLANEMVHAAFKEYAQKNLCRGFAAGRYVMMPDHVHLFVRVGMNGKLDQYVRLMKQSLTKAIRCSGGSVNRSGSGGSMSRSEQDQGAVRRAAATTTEAAHRAVATTEEQAFHRNAATSDAANRAAATTEEHAFLRNAATTKVWQPGFFDHVMRSHESYSEKWNYVRMNPVRAGLVNDPDEWKFQGEIETVYFD